MLENKLAICMWNDHMLTKIIKCSIEVIVCHNITHKTEYMLHDEYIERDYKL